MDSNNEVVDNVQGLSLEEAHALEEVQRLTHYRLKGCLYQRLPYGTETFRSPSEGQHQPCRHCNARQGQLHEPLCDYEQCPVCGGQVMSCECSLYTEDAVQP